jgi:hypothetical protein
MATCSSETSVDFQPTTRRYIPVLQLSCGMTVDAKPIDSHYRFCFVFLKHFLPHYLIGQCYCTDWINMLCRASWTQCSNYIFIYVSWGEVGWAWFYLVRRPLIGLLYQPRMTCDDECGAVGGMRIDRGNRSTRRKPAPVPLYPLQTARDLTWTRTRVAAVVNGRLTAWAMTRPTAILISNFNPLKPSGYYMYHMI